MANTRTLTAANSIIFLSVDTIFTSPVQIQGYSTEDVTDIDPVENSETAMGVDGRLSAGWVPQPYKQTITLQADSLSNDFFDQWHQYEASAQEKYVASGSILLPATNTQYTLTRGYLRGWKPLPPVKKTLQPRMFTIDWQSCGPAPSPSFTVSVSI